MDENTPIATPLTLTQHAAIKEALSIALERHGANILYMTHSIFAALDAAAQSAGSPPQQALPAASPVPMNREQRRAARKGAK